MLEEVQEVLARIQALKRLAEMVVVAILEMLIIMLKQEHQILVGAEAVLAI
tara:strand:+ start:798 stop:950 length:153 start_codon:yes stop_codon:yes gene_type:complete